MPKYFYKAKNLKGDEKSGILEAQSASHLAKLLQRDGYFLISTTEENGIRKPKSLKLDFLNKFTSVSLTEKLFFTRNLGVMIKTGVSLPRAFEILSQQTKNNNFKKALSKISKRIIKGESLSESLGSFPKIFPPLYQETVKIGEETGKLGDVLQIITNQMEREHNLKSSVKTAMVYPTIVLIMTLLIGVFMMIFAVPKLKAVFEDLHINLPFTTKVILGLADFLTHKWPIALLITGFFIFAFVEILKSGKMDKAKSALALKIPIISGVVRTTNSALALRTLSSLLDAGVPIVRSLGMAAGSLDNFYFKKSMEKAAKIVEKGEKISTALTPYKNLYSPMVLQMMAVGEETGETAQVLKNLADFYEEELSKTLERLSSMLEPILILFIGGIVGFFVVSMFQPLYSMMGGIH